MMIIQTKLSPLAVAFLFLVSIPVNADARNFPGDENEFVKVSVSVQRDTTLKREVYELLITFHPTEGIHITSDPAVQFKLATPSSFLLDGPPQQTANEETSYLVTEEPVVQTFKVAKTARPGTRALSGTLTYYFCSDAEGWCRKQVVEVALPLIIKN